MSDNYTNTIVSTLAKGLYLVWADLLSLTAMIGYFWYAYTILKYRTSHFNNSFYTLALSMAVTDTIHLFFNLIYLTPTAIIGTDNMPSWYTVVSGFIVVSAFNISAAHMVAISFNRLAAVILMQTYQAYFTPKKLALIIGFCYLSGLKVTSVLYIFDCPLKVPVVAWQFVCINRQGLGVMYYAVMIGTLYFVFTVGPYVVLLVMIRKKYQNADDETRRQQMRKEKSLVMQFGLIVIFYVLYIGLFFVEFFVHNEFTEGYGLMVAGTLQILHSGLDPFLYMTFGSEVRRLMFSGNSVAPKHKSAYSAPGTKSTETNRND